MKRPRWAIVLFASVALAPIAGSLVYAGLYSVGAVGLLSRGITLDHWTAVLTDRSTWAAIGLSLQVATAVTLSACAGGLALSIALGPRVSSGVWSYFIYVPLALPGTVAAFLVYQVFNGTGMAARVLVGLGLAGDVSDVTSLVHDPWAAGIVIAHTMLAAPFLALTFGGLRESERLDELSAMAASLGATRRQRLSRVVLPVLLRRGASNLALVFVVVLGSYEIPLLLGRQSPQMLSVVVLRKFSRFDLHDKAQAYAVALIYTAIALGILALLLRDRGLARPERES